MQTAFTSGDQLLHYRLLRKIGEGGMGVVYEAEDQRLSRTVAVKLLQSSISSDKAARERFLREARAASAIDHPNLCTIHAVEETPDGSLLLVMALYRGQTLAELLRHGPVDLPRLRAIASQAATGLHAAHMAGIVHRDIKPANIFLLPSGTVKILDFGLSRMSHLQQLTAPHTMMGTLAYMPPEQLAGSDVDYRADIWALGVVIYEMAAGHTPFQQPTHAATISAISSGRYIPLHQARPDLPPGIHAAVHRALQLVARERHTSAIEFLDALLEDGALPASPELTSALTSMPVTRYSGATGDGETQEFATHPAATPAPATPAPARYPPAIKASAWNTMPGPAKGSSSIAVLPMQNLSSDPENEYFSDGLTDELISALSTLPGLRVVSRTSVFCFKGKPQNVREIGRLLEVDAALEGSVRRSGTRIRVNMQLTDVRHGFLVWSSRFDRELANVFELQDELAAAVVLALQKEFAPDLHPTDLQHRTPTQVEAYEDYLKGRYHWGQRTVSSMQQASRYFQKALQHDPGLAAAHAGIADFYSMQGSLGMMPPHEAWKMARSSALTAVALDPALPEAHLALAVVLQFYDWEWEAARQHIVQAIELRPQRGESYFFYVTFLMTQGHLAEALEQAKIGLTYDPLAPPLLAAEAILRMYLGDHDSTILLARSALANSPQYFELYYSMGMAQTFTGRTEEAVATFERGLEHSRMPVLLGWLAEAYVHNGNTQKARDILAQLVQMAEEGNALPVATAVAAAALEEYDLAFSWLEKAAEARDMLVSYVTVLPSLKVLHNDPRYQRLLDRMKLAHPSTHRRQQHETRPSSIQVRPQNP